MQMRHSTKSCGAFGQYVRRWKRCVLSGVRDAAVSDASNWSVLGPRRNVSTLPAGTRFRRAGGRLRPAPNFFDYCLLPSPLLSPSSADADGVTFMMKYPLP